MLGLFCPLKQHVGPSILTVGALYLVDLFDVMLKCSLEFERKFYKCVRVYTTYVFIYAYFLLISTYAIQVYIPQQFKVFQCCRCHLKREEGRVAQLCYILNK
jgi:hypothetical protein